MKIKEEKPIINIGDTFMVRKGIINNRFFDAEIIYKGRGIFGEYY